MKIMMKHTVDYIMRQATTGKVEFVDKIKELQKEIIEERELYFVMR